MVVLSVKFTILISWSPIVISLTLLSALMKLASTSATMLYNSMGSRHPWHTNIRVKGSDRRPFILILDWIFVSVSELPQSRKDKINSKDIIERCLFRSLDSSTLSQIACSTVKLFCF